MFDLDNIHPYYLSIKPEVLVIEMTVQFDSIKVTLTENNTDKVSLFDSSFRVEYTWCSCCFEFFKI